MNNSLGRLIEGMAETLRRDVIPSLDGEFARGQAFGIIYMLNSIRLRAAWSPLFLDEQIEALTELSVSLSRIQNLPADAPQPARTDPGSADPGVLERLRDEGDTAVCLLIGWLHARQTELQPDVMSEANDAVQAYIRRQLRQELRTSARPMFAEISSGEE